VARDGRLIADPTVPGASSVTQDLDADQKFAEWKIEANKHYAAIGLVTANWSYFEAVLDTWIHHFADIGPDVGVCLTSQISGSARKIDALISLIRFRGVSDPSPEALDAFSKKVRCLGEQRNRVAHDMWNLSDPKLPTRLTAMARKKLILQTEPVSTGQLNHLAGSIKTLSNELDSLCEKAFNGWRQRPRGVTPPA
jgi:hypothetical protein